MKYLGKLMSVVNAQKFAPIGALIMADLKGQIQAEAKAEAEEAIKISDVIVAPIVEEPAIVTTTQEIVVEERDLNLELQALEKQISELESIEGAFRKADGISSIIERRLNDGKQVEAHLEFLGNLLLDKTAGYDLESVVGEIKVLRSDRQTLKAEIEAKAEAEAEAKAEAAKDEAAAKIYIREKNISDVSEAAEISEELVAPIFLKVRRQAAAAHARKVKAEKAKAKRVAEAKAEAQAEARARRAAKKAARKAARIQKNGCLLLEKTLKCLKAGATNYDQVASMLKQARKHHLKLEVYIGLMDTINEISDKYDLTMRCVWNVFWSKKRELGFSLKDNLQDIVDLVLHKIELHCNPTSFIAPIKKVVKKVTNVIVDIRKVIYQHKNGKYIRYTY